MIKNRNMFKVGIIGAGWIADKMAEALHPLTDYCVHAIASRSIDKANEFAQRWSIEKAYGSYELDVRLYNDVSGKIHLVVTEK